MSTMSLLDKWKNQLPKRCFAIVDCNSFYASCEQVFRPDLEDKPVVVLSNNDGCVIARNKQAKELNIGMGIPFFKIRHIIQQNKVTVFSSNYKLYASLSKRVMRVLSRFSPEMEVYSIDEAFLDLTGIEDVEAYAQEIKETVLREVGIPVSIGLASSKTLAKLANHIAKKDERKDGVCLLNPELQDEYASMPVQEIWGIGGKTAQKLETAGVRTVGSFMKLPMDWVRKEFKVNGLRTYQELYGISCIRMEHESSPKKGICTTRTFSKKINNYEGVKEALTAFTANVCYKLRKQKSCASHFTVFLQTDSFREQNPYYGSVSGSLDIPTNDTVVATKMVISLLDRIFYEKHNYRKAGVYVEGIVPEGQRQLSLHQEFPEEQVHQQRKLMDAMDVVNQKYGKGSLYLAAQGIKPAFKMKQAKLSPCYTTDWNELMTV
ncbi:Y-family DNA polymerase [Sediminitomix flava]|uniref:DNA polymerase V n=1 Tax=Sediminitomix flava TaxID=379075 RepID=A0A315ZCJ2_SEDFL|nr:Y-family DNA polymerase [Sediminitomix flava]PWJ43251.1 DNA polymerase V [Sediminitomix flava]